MQIRISPDKLRSAANEQITIMNEIEKSAAAMDQIEERLRASWEGVAGRQIRSIVETTKVAVQKLAEEVQESAQDLNETARAFESIDNLNGSNYRTLHIIPGIFNNIIPSPIRPMILDFVIFQSGEIRIVPDEVREIAAECKREANEIEEKKARFRVIVNKMRDDWEGNSCNKYMEGVEDIIRAFDEVIDSISEMADKMNMAANRYEEIDNTL